MSDHKCRDYAYKAGRNIRCLICDRIIKPKGN